MTIRLPDSGGAAALGLRGRVSESNVPVFFQKPILPPGEFIYPSLMVNKRNQVEIFPAMER
jgi:hypothetical protein